MIWESLQEPLIMLDIDASTKDDVMKKMGSVLIEQGYAKDTYVDSLINREMEFPTGLDVDGVGIAIPHTDVSQVNRPATAIGVLRKPVKFIQMGTDDEVETSIVFMLSVVDPNAHLAQLQRIISIIQDANVLNRLLEVKDKDSIIEVIKEKEIELDKVSKKIYRQEDTLRVVSDGLVKSTK